MVFPSISLLVSVCGVSLANDLSSNDAFWVLRNESLSTRIMQRCVGQKPWRGNDNANLLEKLAFLIFLPKIFKLEFSNVFCPFLIFTFWFSARKGGLLPLGVFDRDLGSAMLSVCFVKFLPQGWSWWWGLVVRNSRLKQRPEERNRAQNISSRSCPLRINVDGFYRNHSSADAC